MSKIEHRGFVGSYSKRANGSFFGKVVNCKDPINFCAMEEKQLVTEFKVSVDIYLDWCQHEKIVPNLIRSKKK